MQGNIVMAFRKRLKRWGYTDISIVKSSEGDLKYTVTAIEPLAKTLIRAEYTLEVMHRSFKQGY